MQSYIKHKIAVVGAGAIGSIVGGLLAKAGEDVTLIGRKTHVDNINRHGLTIDGIMGEMKIDVIAKESLDFEPDIVILSVKTQDVKIAAQEIKSHVSKSTIITMQNGVESDKIAADILGENNILSCVVLFGGTFIEPGKVTLTNYNKKGSLVIGQAFGDKSDKIEMVTAILNKALPAVKTSDIHGAHWTKLILNQVNAIPAVTGLSMQEVSKNRKLVKLQILLMREGLHVIEKSGVKLCSLPGIPIFIIKFMINFPLIFSLPFFAMQSKVLGDIPVPGSILQSIMRSETTEIDYLNGEIINLGKNLNISTPYNSAIVDLVHKIAKTKKFVPADKLMDIIENQYKISE